MTRIIAGFAGSLAIVVPGQGTRPTSDRVREAIFSSLDARGVLPGSRVVDLYAGSGALGLEAASRGAAHVTLVESATNATATCTANAATVRKNAPPRSELEIVVAGTAVQSFLRSSHDRWDVAFLDPPYDLAETELAHCLVALLPWLEPRAIVVVERSSRSPEPTWPTGLELDRRKNYGDTSLWWALCAVAEPVVSTVAVDPTTHS